MQPGLEPGLEPGQEGKYKELYLYISSRKVLNAGDAARAGSREKCSSISPSVGYNLIFGPFDMIGEESAQRTALPANSSRSES
jgi:hypothetical protein